MALHNGSRLERDDAFEEHDNREGGNPES